MPDLISTLKTPPSYHCIISERFRIAPDLQPFPTDFGQGVSDQCIFQLDASYHRYLSEKQTVRQRRPNQFYREQDLTPAVRAAVCRYIVNQLTLEHPNYFRLRRQGDKLELHNALRDSQLSFRSTTTGLQWQPDAASQFDSGLDALAMQLQEDLVVLSRDGDRHWMSAIHLCFPNHWSAAAKIGGGFSEVHQPVPHFQRIAAMESRLVNAMVERGPYVRFTWGVSVDDRLDHHPLDRPGARFDPAQPQLYVRLERQCIVGLPAQDCALFTIRTYYYDVQEMQDAPELLGRLRSAIESMSEATLEYKGIRHDREAILNWLGHLQSPQTTG